MDFPSTASKPKYSGYADGHQSWRDDPAELMQLAAAIRHWNWHLILYICIIYICIIYMYYIYMLIIIQYHSYFQDVALCHLVSSCFDWLLWPAMVTYGIFLSFFFTCVCPSIIWCHDSGRCTGAAAQRLALAVAVAVNSFRDVRF